MPSEASVAGCQPAARRWAGLAVVLLACACSRGPGPPAGAGREAGPVASPAVSAADEHLARGELARVQEKYTQAREELERARDLFEQDQSWEGSVRAENGLGAVARRQGNYKAALEHLNAALTTAQEKLAPGHLEVARSYEEIGSVHASTGRPAEALELLGKALAMRRAAGAGQLPEVAEVLRRMGEVHSNQGDDEQALVLFEDGEAILRAVPGRPGLAETLISKGIAYWGLGKYDQAIAAFEQAIEILDADKDAPRQSLASAYANLGTAYWSKSDYDEALIFYEKALPLQVASLGERHQNVGMTHFNVATLYFAKRNYDGAIASAERALRIFLPALGERHSLVVSSYNVLGSAYTAKGDPDRALGLLTKALAIQRSMSGERDRDSAVIYSSLADARRARGDLAEAAADYHKALAVDLAIHGERHPDVAEDFVNLGDLHLQKGDLGQALELYSRAIAANDPLRAGTDLDLDPPLDTAYSEEYLLNALKGAARARARRGAERKRRTDVEQAALVYEHASRLIERMRAGYRAEGSKLRVAASATETYDEAIQNALELHRLTGKERHVEAAFRYAEKSKAGVLRDALREAEARQFAGIPGELLEQERTLRIDLAAAENRLAEAQLESAVEEARLHSLREEQFSLRREYEALRQRFEKNYPDYYELKYRFETIGTAEIRDRALDDRAVLVEYFLGKERVFIFTITRAGLEVTDVPRDASLEVELQELRQAILARNLASHARSARRLYRMLLSPVAGRLAGKDLVVVPDGPLSTLPFEALLERDVGTDPRDARELPYVLRDHAVSYAYSATLLLQGLRHASKDQPDEFVGFAPLFTEVNTAVDAPRPLPASRKEVEDVRALFRKRTGLFGGWLTGRSRVYLGREATEGRVKSAGLERYRYVHIATHGIVDEQHPGLSRLLLTPKAGSGEDGVLHLGEIYNLHLNADLVALSACDTGGGSIARGEGIIGLTRGFLYAGARSLLVSLWPVSDAASADLVVAFYSELLEGRPKAQALREAKLRTMQRSPEYAKPYYWSSLVLVGQSR